MSTNRRDFLKRSGGLALAGWAGASGLAAVAEATVTPLPAAPPSPGAGSVERWLLETGRREIDDDVYSAVANGKA
jgi:anaerobic selenocysteine-containing dehydrogenase